jgi:hypothetical protein
MSFFLTNRHTGHDLSASFESAGDAADYARENGIDLIEYPITERTPRIPAINDSAQWAGVLGALDRVSVADLKAGRY